MTYFLKQNNVMLKIKMWRTRSYKLLWLILIFQSGQLDLKHFDPEFVREPVPGKKLLRHVQSELGN